MKKFNIVKHRKTYQIIGIMILCIVLILISYNFTLSWFMDESVTSNNPTISVVGTIDMKVTTNFDFYNLVLAPDTTYTTDQGGQDIGTYIRTNDSTAGGNHDVRGVYVRIKSTITKESVASSELSLYFADGVLTSTLPTASYASSDSGKWVYNPADDYYYYLGAISTTNIQFNAGYKTNNTFTNSIANDNVNIHFVIEAIQRPYGAYKAVWTTAPNVFNTFAYGDTGV